RLARRAVGLSRGDENRRSELCQRSVGHVLARQGRGGRAGLGRGRQGGRDDGGGYAPLERAAIELVRRSLLPWEKVAGHRAFLRTPVLSDGLRPTDDRVVSRIWRASRANPHLNPLL